MRARGRSRFSGGSIPGESLFLAGLADIASLELEQALVGDVGVPLDIFQIRPGRGALGGLGTPSLVLGTEIVDDVFLTLETGLFTLFGPGEADASTWALTLQWRIDPEWTLDLGFEPVHRRRGLRGIGPLIPIADVQRQIFIELRRRWTY